MKRSAIVMGVVGGSLLVVIGTQGGCTLASPTHITMEPGLTSDKDGGAASSSSSSSSSSGGGAGGANAANAVCGTDDFITPDLTKLTGCGDGKGHCFAKTKTPMAATFIACANAADVCVPNEILLAGGKPLAVCKAIVGNGGGCINMKLIPEMEKRSQGMLKQETCEAHQICAPCIDPTNGGAETGLCKPIGVHEKECSANAAPGGGGGAEAPPTQAAQACCTTKGKSNGMCLAAKDLPPEKLKDTVQDTCADEAKCVPTAFVQGKPVKCDSGIMGSGVCLDKCFNKMMSIAGGIGFLSQDVCGETEVCIPCSFAKDQGAPGCD